tara:strand:- start:566 stop:1603 length:1038 start_codon:yes stop_codon:yes gene_type:complete
MKRNILVFVLLMGFVSFLKGEEGYAFQEFYEIEVQLEGTDRLSLMEGMRSAFQDLMLTLSGNSEINNTLSVIRASKDPQVYVSEYRLSSKEGKVFGNFSFNGEEVRKLLSENSLPLWIGIKPKVLLFLPCKSDSFLVVDQKEILERRREMCSQIIKDIKSRGVNRNIVFIEPVLDLIDLKTINLYEPRADQEFLNKISSRYNLEEWMICYIQDQYGLFISDPFCLSPVSAFKETSLNKMVDLLADELTKDFQLNIDPNVRNKLKVFISGLSTYEDLISLEKIIGSNALIDSYSLSSISKNDVTYSLLIRGQILDLKKLMDVNPVLVSKTTSLDKAELRYQYILKK